MGIGNGGAAVMEGIHASAAALGALFLEDASLRAGAAAGGGVDVLQRQYELRLDRMMLVSRLEAQLAALKAWDAAESIELHQAMTAPEASAQDLAYGEMSAVEEIAGVLTISSGAAGAFVQQSRRLCALPAALDALASGAVSWQHARIIADETEGLGPAGAAALVAHFLDPDAPNRHAEPHPVSWCPHGSGQRCGPGANATTPNPSKNATPRPSPTGGSNTARTVTE